MDETLRRAEEEGLTGDIKLVLDLKRGEGEEAEILIKE